MTITYEQAAALRDAADAWQAAPIGSEAEFDAAGEMYSAIHAVLGGDRAGVPA